MIQKVGHTKTLCKSRKDSFLLVCSDLTLLKNTINTINRFKKKKTFLDTKRQGIGKTELV